MNGQVHVWNAESGELIAVLQHLQPAVDDDFLLKTAKYQNKNTPDRRIRIYSDEFVADYPECIMSVSFSPNGRQIVSCSLDMIKLWDANTFERLMSLDGHTGPVSSMSLSSDDSRMVSTEYTTSNINIWNLQNGIRLKNISSLYPYPLSSAISPSGDQFVVGCMMGFLSIWDLKKGEIFKDFGLIDFFDMFFEEIYMSSYYPVYSLDYSPSGNHIIAAHGDMSVKLWNAETASIEATIPIKSMAQVTTIGFLPDGKRIITGTTDRMARMWDIQTQSLLKLYSYHTKPVLSTAISRDGKFLLTGSADRNAILWDIETSRILKIFKGHSDDIQTVSISPNQKLILTGSLDKTVKLWDANTGEILLDFSDNTRDFSSSGFLSDGKSFVVGNMDGIVRLYEIDSPRMIIAAGGGDYPGNAIVEQTRALAAYVYSICLARGYDKQDVQWLSAFSSAQDADGDGQNDVSGLLTKESLRRAILEWARADLISPGRRLLIYAIDHGYPISESSGERDIYFRLNETETISARELDVWLDELNTPDINLDVTLIVDCCYSGGFVERYTPPEGYERLVVASTTNDTEAMIMPPPDLSSFSYLFWGALYMGASMQEALNASDVFFRQFSINGQRPQMDDTGDGQYSEADGLGMGQNRFGRSWAYAGQGTGEFPAFESVNPPADQIVSIQSGASVALNAQVIPDSVPEEVWAVIRPPAPETIVGEPLSSTEVVQQISLHPDSQKPNFWTGQFDSTASEGLYIVSFTAKFAYNRLSRPKIASFRVGEDANPDADIALQALLVAGGGTWRSFAQEMVDYAIKVCDKRGYENRIQVLGRYTPTGIAEVDSTLKALAESSLSKRTRLLIYFVGDALSGGHLILNDSETFPVESLMETLDKWQNQYENLEIILVADCPYAGTFVEANRQGPAGRRVVLAGSTSDEPGFYLDSRGARIAFSQRFFNSAYQGNNLRYAFQGSVLLCRDILGKSNPMLDDTGDGVQSKTDGNLARNWYIGRRGMLAGPDAAALPMILRTEIHWDSKTETIAAEMEMLEAALPVHVGLTILPDDGNGNVEEIELMRIDDSWIWSAAIPCGKESLLKKYLGIFHAQYPEDQLAEPVVVPFTIEDTPVADWSVY